MPPTHQVIQAIRVAMPLEGTEPYKFYEKGVKTLADVKEYLRTWFIRQPGGYSREWDGAHYTLVMGFRRGFCSHRVFVDTDTCRYIFTCDEEKEIPPFVTGEFSSFEATPLAHGVQVPQHAQQHPHNVNGISIDAMHYTEQVATNLSSPGLVFKSNAVAEY
eukprot:gene9355-16479_t